jgi:hypothetical protein
MDILDSRACSKKVRVGKHPITRVEKAQNEGARLTRNRKRLNEPRARIGLRVDINFEFDIIVDSTFDIRH